MFESAAERIVEALAKNKGIAMEQIHGPLQLHKVL